MSYPRPTGRQAASRKYDILTALGVHACNGNKHLQRLVLRFITLIVARYNWQADELAVGQREIAALWSVDERTVKREMARLRELGWISVKAAAGRGRVAVHGLQVDSILTATADDWARVGRDFDARMRGAEETAVAPPGNVVAFPRPAALAGDATLWERARHRLAQQNPALCAAWFDGLEPREAQGGGLDLLAPTRFHADYLATHHFARLLDALMREGLARPALTISARRQA